MVMDQFKDRVKVRQHVRTPARGAGRQQHPGMPGAMRIPRRLMRAAPKLGVVVLLVAALVVLSGVAGRTAQAQTCPPGHFCELGGSEEAWIIGTNPVYGGYGIYQWNGAQGTWKAVDGGAVRIAVGLFGQPWVVNDQGNIYRRVQGRWELLPGRAHDIGVGADGSAWIIGTNPVPGGYDIYRWNGTGWTGEDGGAVAIAVGPNGQPWVVNDQGSVYRLLRGRSGLLPARWESLPGRARDIGVGRSGYAWIIGTNPVYGGYGIYSWNESTRTWSAVDGGAVRISVGAFGTPWVVNAWGNIYRRNQGRWEQLPGGARDIAVTSN